MTSISGNCQVFFSVLQSVRVSFVFIPSWFFVGFFFPSSLQYPPCLSVSPQRDEYVSFKYLIKRD